MKCDLCGSEWSVPEKLKQTIAKCPFCGADLNVKKDKTITDVLVEWGRKEGLDFFRNSLKINGILSDFFPGMERERNAIKVGLEKGIGAKIIQLHYEDDEGIRSIQISQIERVLLDDAWLSESATEFVINTFITASDIVGGKNIRKYCPKVKNLQDNRKTKSVGDGNNKDTSVQMVPDERKEEVAKQKSVSVQITELLTEGQRHETSKNYEEAIKVYEKAYKLGDVEAAFRIAEIYYMDEGTVAESLRWYTVAANQEQSKAQNSLGYMYEHGEVVSMDKKKAFYWYQKAAINGNRNAQHNLAFFYYQGLGTQTNYKKAFEWYTKAASQGHPGSQNNLGVMYEYGYGVGKDINQAMRWYKRAADNDNKNGLNNYKRCVKLTASADTLAGVAGGVNITPCVSGNIHRIHASVGASVNSGDPIITLKTMGMLVTVIAPQDGKIASINVNIGDTVETGEVLATMN